MSDDWMGVNVLLQTAPALRHLVPTMMTRVERGALDLAPQQAVHSHRCIFNHVNHVNKLMSRHFEVSLSVFVVILYIFIQSQPIMQTIEPRILLGSVT